ncbi:DUF2617 family protein [Salinactinospora qingdaonensis]|uniref:DUF2617 family protein n=1 Tax=Salinactinospora qingdaonensis TaxID=702744 RepID=A0ABP7EWX5_9ACTN
MRATITAPFVDTRAADLVWTLDYDLAPALALHPLHLADTTVELRVLGASHQVVVRGEAPDAEPLVETVACLPDVPGGLPARATPRLPRTCGVDSYDFRSAVTTPDDFAARARALYHELDGDSRGLVVAFPGHPLALTGVRAETRPQPLGRSQAHVVSWQTWHAYPQSGEIVETTTSLTLRTPFDPHREP